MSGRRLLSWWFALSMCICGSLRAEATYEIGFGKADITPTVPLRLSGYGNRSAVAEGNDDPIFARAMALRDASQQLSILVSVDTIGFPGALTKSIATRVQEAHGIPRSRFVLCCTHSHTTPHVAGGLTNLFATPVTAQQAKDIDDYTAAMSDQILSTVGQALADLRPGRLFAGAGNVGFARNRRMIQQEQWTGFGVRPEGPVDHTLPVLQVTDAEGQVRGVLFNYACHCTTFGGGYNRVNGDWAGYAARFLEEAFPHATALCTIGCGADQNPVRDENPERAMALAVSHGRQIATEVERLFSGEMREITAEVATSFGYAGLPVDRPSLDNLKQALEDRQPQVRQHAQNMLAVHERMGRLPETYPAPIQVWRFGDELCMVFLGGEVVVDYALRLTREIESRLVWVSAYCNDVFGYVASERVRREGGYEVSGSMIYYNQPGPWAEGTEEVLVRRIHELVQQGSFAGPYRPEDALETFRLPNGMSIGIVAAEPLIADPVSFAVGADGRLWVVEMGDYPRGEDDHGAPGGRVRVLDDDDGDGRYDRSTVFLDGLSYPNGVFPWRDGVLISGAPAILFATDSNGDDRADEVVELFTGFSEGNPQHRVSGFAFGLDNWLYLAAGANNHRIRSSLTGDTVDVGGQDFRIQPDKGLIETVEGHTQYGRNRDDWGNWFGGNNSQPIWHYVIPDRYIGRNPYVATSELKVDLHSPAFAPQVFPASRTLDRFNDLFALNRFTSACSPIIFRDESLGAEVYNAAFVSEPVHNLVHRAMLSEDSITFRALRHPDEASAEFLASTDHWFRPTTVATGPDGALWVADMYRQVIEHPQWIPEAWQVQLDLRAGHERGRIYRVFRTDTGASRIPNLAQITSDELVLQLQHPNGWRRDTAQRLLVERGDRSVGDQLTRLIESSGTPLAKVHALGTLQGLDILTVDHIVTALEDPDARLQRHAILLGEPLLAESEWLGHRLLQLVDHPDPRVRLQLALSLGEWSHADAAAGLIRLARNDPEDAWMRAAVLSSSVRHADVMLENLLSDHRSSDGQSLLVQGLISTALGSLSDDRLAQVLQSITTFDGQPASWQIEALTSFDRALRRRDASLAKLLESTSSGWEKPLEQAAHVVDAARLVALEEKASLEHRLHAIALLGRGIDPQEDLAALAELLVPQQQLEVQSTAVESLAQFHNERASEILLQNWRQLSPRVQSEILVALLSREKWQEGLVAALEAGYVRLNDLDATARVRLTSIDNRQLRDRAQKLIITPPSDNRGEVLEKFRTVKVLSGDPVRGAEKFQATCAACHRHNGQGNEFGPQLAALTDKSDEALLVAILDPNRAIENKYKSYTCVTVDGRTLSGMIISESASSITLAQPDGTQRVLLRVDIDELASTGVSFMPVGLEQDLQPQDLADLFEFIRQADPSQN